MIILDFDGKIKGSCNTKGHENKIPCTSMGFSISRNITYQKGTIQRQLSNPEIRNIRITKLSDIATPDLFRQSCVGTGSLTKATIVFIESADEPRVYQEYELTDPIIASFVQSSAGEGHPEDDIEINFTKITVKYHGKDGKNATADTEAAYDIGTGMVG